MLLALSDPVNTGNHSTNGVQGVQLRVIPGLRGYGAFSQGLHHVVYDFDSLDYHQRCHSGLSSVELL